LCVITYADSFQPNIGTREMAKRHVNHHNRFIFSSQKVTGSHTNEGEELSRSKREHGLDEANENLDQLYRCLGAEPRDIFQIKDNDDGVRGMYLNYSVEAGDVLLRIPLSSCLRDDQPPSWIANNENVAWTTRLAASLLEIQHNMSDKEKLRCDGVADDVGDVRQGHYLWWKQILMPQADLLKQALPTHWDGPQLEYANCRSLELAVEASRLSRAGALSDLKSSPYFVENNDEDATHSWNDNYQTAIDFVQTRCCGVTLPSDGKRLIIVAPIFDLLNHATGDGQNAEFLLEELNKNDEQHWLVLRSKRNMEANEEVNISYGDQNLTPWKCLASYGFVPPFDEAHATAEISINGVWGELTAGNLPYQLIEASYKHLGNTQANEKDGIQLTAPIVIHVTDTARKTALTLEENEDDAISSQPNQQHQFQAKRLRMSQRLFLNQWSAALLKILR